MKLPATVDEVTAEWLTDALSVSNPGTVVRSIKQQEIIHGTATKLLLRLEYDAPTNVPEQLCLKGGFDPMQRMIGGVGFLVEVRFFEDVAPLMPVPLPACWFADTEGLPDGQSIVILDDLRSRARFGNPTQVFDIDTAAKTLELMAAWHGAFWDGRNLADAGWLTVGSPALRSVIGVLTSDEHWNTHMALPKADPIPQGSLRDAAVVRAGMERLWAFDAADAHTFLHGDTHIGNTYFEGDAPRFLDWQSPMLGPWSHDVSTFLGGALAIEDRRSAERDLLRLYLGALRAAGGPEIPEDEAWLGYRRHLLHGFLWVLTPEEMQPVENTAAMTERFAAAAVDLETLNAIGF